MVGAPSVQDTSAGSIKVEICAPARLTAMASAASAAMSSGSAVRRIHPDTVPASASMSDSNGASNFLW
jgi:hypothetical protein